MARMGQDYYNPPNQNFNQGSENFYNNYSMGNSADGGYIQDDLKNKQSYSGERSPRAERSFRDRECFVSPQRRVYDDYVSRSNDRSDRKSYRESDRPERSRGQESRKSRSRSRSRDRSYSSRQRDRSKERRRDRSSERKRRDNSRERRSYRDVS